MITLVSNNMDKMRQGTRSQSDLSPLIKEHYSDSHVITTLVRKLHGKATEKV